MISIYFTLLDWFRRQPENTHYSNFKERQLQSKYIFLIRLKLVTQKIKNEKYWTEYARACKTLLMMGTTLQIQRVHVRTVLMLMP